MNDLPIDHSPLPAISLTHTDKAVCDLVQAFLSGRSKRTIEAYSHDLADFTKFLGLPSVTAAVNDLLSRNAGGANHQVLRYRVHLIERELSPATINRRLAAIRSLVRLASMLGLISWEVKIQGIKSQPYRDTKGPGRQAFIAMLDCARNGKEPKATRDQLILRLLHDLALRASEVANLDLADFEETSSGLWVLGKGKTQKEKLTLPEPVMACMSRWLVLRGKDEGPLVAHFGKVNRGGRISRAGIHHVVSSLGKTVGIKAFPHGLRHSGLTFACIVAQQNGYGLEEVLDFSRHSRRSIATLMIYRDRQRNVQGKLASLVSVPE